MELEQLESSFVKVELEEGEVEAEQFGLHEGEPHGAALQGSEEGAIVR